MKRLLLAMLLKHNGALAGLCVFFLVVATSFHVMHGKFEQASLCEAAQPSIAKSSPLDASKQAAACQALAARQNATFDLFELFFSRS